MKTDLIFNIGLKVESPNKLKRNEYIHIIKPGPNPVRADTYTFHPSVYQASMKYE